jgi:hypothetical protein
MFRIMKDHPSGADPCSLDTPRHGYHAMEKKGIMELEVTA